MKRTVIEVSRPGQDGLGAATDWATMRADVDRQAARVIDVRDYGAKGDGVTDDTAAIQAAINAAPSGTDYFAVVWFPRGIYLAHELDAATKQCVLSGGDSPRSSVIMYNGTGGAGSYLVDMGGKSFGGLTGIALEGVDPGYTTICETLVKLSFIDNMSVWRDVQFQRCSDDAIRVAADGTWPGEIFNWHLQGLRFDAIGGWCIHATGPAVAYSQITLRDWTSDNAVRHELIPFLQGKGLFTNRWGKGVLRVADATGIHVHLADGRVEINERPVLTTGVSRIVQGLGGAGTWTLSNISGYANHGEPTALLSIADANSRTTFDQGTHFYDAKLLEWEGNPNDQKHNLQTSPGAEVIRPGNFQGQQGIRIGTQLVESRDIWDGYAWSQVFGSHRQGDLMLNMNPVAGKTGVGRVVVAPSLYSQFAGETLTTAAATTSGSTSVSLAAAPDDMKKLKPMSEVVIVGAGAGGADLKTTITGWNGATNTITIATAAGTTKNPATIRFQTPTVKEFGDICSYAAAEPASGTYYTGEKVWNTSPTELGSTGSKYIILGWLNIAGGTPGLWRQMRVLTGN